MSASNTDVLLVTYLFSFLNSLMCFGTNQGCWACQNVFKIFVVCLYQDLWVCFCFFASIYFTVTCNTRSVSVMLFFLEVMSFL